MFKADDIVNPPDILLTPWLIFECLYLETQEEDTVRIEFANKVSHEPVSAWSSIQPHETFIIYKWARFSCIIDADHPLLPLFWQSFLKLYFSSVLVSPSQFCYYGQLFLDKAKRTTLLAHITRRLVFLTRHHQELSIQCPDQDSPASNHHKKLSCFYQSINLWLTDTRLQGARMTCPSGLPPEYNESLLKYILHEASTPWRCAQPLLLDLISFGLQKTRDSLLSRQFLPSFWLSLKGGSKDNGRRTERPKLDQTLRLKMLRDRRPEEKVPDLFQSIPIQMAFGLQDLTVLHFAIELIREDLLLLVGAANEYKSRLDRCTKLDIDYLLELPTLYVNVSRQVNIEVECKRVFSKPCQGSGRVILVLKLRETVPEVQMRLKRNREAVSARLVERVLKDGISVASFRIKNMCTTLIDMLATLSNVEDRQKVFKAGSSLFYFLIKSLSDVTKTYPPTFSLLWSCIRQLGDCFVVGNPDEVRPVLDIIFATTIYVDELSYYFNPQVCPTETIALYKEITTALCRFSVKSLVTLLKCFNLQEWLRYAQPIERYYFNYIYLLCGHLIKHNYVTCTESSTNRHVIIYLADIGNFFDGSNLYIMM